MSGPAPTGFDGPPVRKEDTSETAVVRPLRVCRCPLFGNQIHDARVSCPPASPPSPLVFPLRGEMIELGLVRKLLYRLELLARREGDELLVFERLAEHPRETRPGFWAGLGPYPEGDQTGSLYVDEGFYDSTLKNDLTVGSSAPWEELVSLLGLVRLLAIKYEPQFPIEATPYVGLGRTDGWYTAQYTNALVGGDQGKHPGVMFVR